MRRSDRDSDASRAPVGWIAVMTVLTLTASPAIASEPFSAGRLARQIGDELATAGRKIRSYGDCVTGWYWSKRGDQAKALEYLKRTIQRDPDEATWYEARVDFWMRNNEPRKALDDMNAGIRLCPDVPYMYLERADIWEKLNEHDQALADCNAAFAINPKLASAFGQFVGCSPSTENQRGPKDGAPRAPYV